MHWIWRNIIICTLTGLGIIVFIYYSETGTTPDLKTHFQPIIAALLLFSLVGSGMHYLSLRYNGFMPWNKSIATRFFLEVASGLLLLAAASLVFVAIFLMNIQLADSESTFWQEYWDGAVKFGIISLVIIYIYSLVNFSIYSYNQYSVHQVDKLREQRNQLNLQFEALKTQLSPHFLFNSLNTISSLIYKDILLTEDFIRRLAHTYRYILRTNDQMLISVKSEIEMLRSYFFMQKLKYEECIALQDTLDGSVLNSLIPPLTLQILIENALKHNLICDDRKLLVEIMVDESDFLVIKNNIIPKTELLKIGNNLVDRPGKEKSHKIGLNNIKSRYAFFTNKKLEIIKNKDFIVKLPLIRQHIESENLL